MRMRIVTLAERPDLCERGIPRRDGWPEYNLHGDILRLRMVRLFDDLPEFQLFGLSDDDEVLCEGNAAPYWWDGSPAHLPNGIDATLTDALARLDEGQPVNTCARWPRSSPPRRGGWDWRGRSWRPCASWRDGPASGMVFPDPGPYVIPGGLAGGSMDLGRDIGHYWEPNVWMINAL